MREIKFRGFRSEGTTQGWVYGYLVVPATDRLLGSHITTGAPHIVDENGHVWIVEVESVGQFTGLKDKDGKEIYEGDIIRAAGERDDLPTERLGAVTWVRTGYDLILQGVAINYGFFDTFPAQVIGNVFDNPDLIKP